MTRATTLATFWSGPPLQALDKACLLSFVRRGHRVILYSYNDVVVPGGIETADASVIADRSVSTAFLYKGQPNMQHFTDYFRYKLFQQEGHTWIDTDLMSLATLDSDGSQNLFALETSSSVCGAIMRIKSDSTLLSTLVARAEQMKGIDLVWGATGPRLLSQVLGHSALVKSAHPPSIFFPIHYDDFWKPFLPECLDECQTLCRYAKTLHLWNNIVVRMGVWKDLSPPVGSFLHAQLASLDLIPLFKETYPVENMRHLVNNWQLRKSGADIGILKVLQQLGPSFARTLGPRIRASMQMYRRS